MKIQKPENSGKYCFRLCGLSRCGGGRRSGDEAIKAAVASSPRTSQAITLICSTPSPVPDTLLNTLCLVLHLVITVYPSDPSDINRHMPHEAEARFLCFHPGMSHLEEQWRMRKTKSSWDTASLIRLGLVQFLTINNPCQ